jgi:hypothetical protein
MIRPLLKGETDMGMKPRTALTGLFVIAGAVLFSIGAGQPSSAKERRPMPRSVPALGNLIVSRSVYQGAANLITVGHYLPGLDKNNNAVKANADGAYPEVFNNETVDGSFGVTSPMIIDKNALTGTLPVPLTSFTLPDGVLVTSFPSKSEMGLHLSTDGTQISLMGYVAHVNEIDVSNSDTFNHLDSNNPVKDLLGNSLVAPTPATPTLVRSRGIALFDAVGLSTSANVITVNAYSGNNGRGAILDSGSGIFFLTGNAGNGSIPKKLGTYIPPLGIVDNTGVQMILAAGNAANESTVVGVQNGNVGDATGFQFGFAVQNPPLSYDEDKSGKDNNYRGLAIYNNTLYVTKGSGGNGINTVYQVGGPNALPTMANASTTTFSIVPGFPTNLASDDASKVKHPFGLWFASPAVLYVADEGGGADVDSGLQKWMLQGDGTWKNVYTLQKGMGRGTAYDVQEPVAPHRVISPKPDGLRALTGRNNGDGTVTLFAVTSTVGSSIADAGADPNQIVAITDTLTYDSANLASGESFNVVLTARWGEVLRGVEFVPLSQAAYLTNLLQQALNEVQALPASDFKNNGEMQSLISVLSGLLSDVQDGNFGNGISNRLQDLIKKAGKITDQGAQAMIVAQLNAALAAVGGP